MRITYLLMTFLLVTPICELLGQMKCDSLSDQIFVATDSPPKMDKTIEDVESSLNSCIDLNKSPLKTSELFISLTINCKGEDFNYKVLNYSDIDFNKLILDCLQNNITWTPAEHRGKKVDFSYVFTIKIENNKFNILSDKEKKKIKRRDK